MLPLIPWPRHCAQQEGQFVLGRGAAISAEQELSAAAKALAAAIEQFAGWKTPVHIGRDETVALRLRIDPRIPHAEGYRLKVSAAGVEVSGATAAGVFYGIQTLGQIICSAVQPGGKASGDLALPLVTIEDQPRFGWRGLMLDVSRHFFDADSVCRFLDLMALHKFNRFHWHLTDDQGWRLPVRKYPRLTEVGGFRDYTLIGHEDSRPRRYDDIRYGGFYAPEDIHRVVRHAASLHITVVPEIDMPGHMQAAIAAYPELGCTTATIRPRCHWGISQHILNPRESTVRFMQDVLAEVLELFPGEFVHIGGDEAWKHQWTESREVQDRMRELGLTSEASLQSWFIGRMQTFLADHGRRLIGWDEILEGGLPCGAAVMSWRGTEGGIAAAGAGHDVVMTPNTHTYFDYYQRGPAGEPLAIRGTCTTENVYSFDPVPGELPPELHKHILGGQGQLWAEYIGSMRHLEYMAYPRSCALAEVLWSDRDHRDFSAFSNRMRGHQTLLDRHQVNSCPTE
jgi:hexosaminidase